MSTHHFFTDAGALYEAREQAFSQMMDLVFERHDFYRERLAGLGPLLRSRAGEVGGRAHTGRQARATRWGSRQ